MLEVSAEQLGRTPVTVGTIAAGRHFGEQLEALDRLFTVGHGLTLEASRCAVFLLGWFYPGEVGGIDLSLVAWKVSPAVAADMALVFQLMVQLQQRGVGVSQLGLEDRARALLAAWFPEVLGLAPRPPAGTELKAFRRRHDLTPQACAELVRVPTALYKEWEQDCHPIPLTLWIELRTLMGERRLRSTPRGVAMERAMPGRFA
ncbi:MULTISPECIES: DUF7673 family protein [Pseudomonas]|uniref:DUF7673 domain-containing protein n=1 Tax=Pseudomonas asplenii TaxID=53407 RepID=A0A0M9GEP1_9PSED|nr:MULTISPECIES: hypothetical protein [Pseudomonas]KPA89286.1 hypothetical protein PF66_04137 [Pseudomonas fuscovaginae]KPA98481.1 hypothetical protein PF70_01410 [Pseudomonas fuscovaginae]